GSLLLAAAGLLEGRLATTHWAYADRLEAYGARYQPYRPAGWVTDGKFTTAAGVSGAIDMAIGLGAKMTNQATAQFAQLMIEYDPHPPLGRLDWTTFDRDRAALAALMDQNMPAQDPARDIAFVIYPGLTVFDLVGPLQVFSALRRIAPEFRPRVVAELAGPITTDSGLRVVPNGTFDDLPHPYAFFVPGGDTATLNIVSHHTNEETARRVQWLNQYDPQPPFGGIDYQHMKLLPRVIRGMSSLRAPLYTRKPRQLTRLGV